MSTRQKTWVISLFLLAGCWQLSTDEVLSRISERAKKIESFKAKMVTSTEMLGQTMEIEADVWFKMPDKIKTETNLSGLLGKQTIVSDGKTLWMFFPTLNQATKMDMGGLNEQMKNQFMGQSDNIREPFKNFKREGIKYIKKEKIEKEETYLLEATMPEMPDSLVKLSKARFWVSTNDGMARKIVFYGEKEKEAMSVICRNVEVNSQIDDSLFSFIPPPSTKIMDMREMMGSFPMFEMKK